jgi:23S rRNA pseudouridine1911/1915/1917 synthase
MGGVGYYSRRLREPRDASLTVQETQAGATLAAVLRELLPGTSWSKVRDLCREGRARVNGEPEADSARRLEAGDRVEVGPPARGAQDRPTSSRPTTGELIVHLDADVAVVRKPAGLLTVPFTGEEKDTLLSLSRVAVRRLDAARGADHGPSLRVVQRLDKETSGLVVFARTVAAQRRLQEQLGEHTVTRRYLAIVHGEARDAIYDTFLVPDRGDGLRGSWGVFRAPRGTPPAQGRQAVTHVRVKERLRGATLVTCELETGRQHQIRIHLAEAGFPLVGEAVYIRDYEGPRIAAPRPMLHAAVLGFVHPRTGKPVQLEDPPPADFDAVLARLRR